MQRRHEEDAPVRGSELAGKDGQWRIVPDLPFASLALEHLDVWSQQVRCQRSPYQTPKVTPVQKTQDSKPHWMPHMALLQKARGHHANACGGRALHGTIWISEQMWCSSYNDIALVLVVFPPKETWFRCSKNPVSL